MNEYDITAAFQAVEEELIASMIRNMDRHRAEEIAGGYKWSMWQAEQIKSLEKYKRENQKKYKKEFSRINTQIEGLIRQARQTGNMEQELRILQAIRKGYKVHGKNKSPAHQAMSASFFRLNERKLEALIEATTHDMEKAETAILRMANDRYRKAIFNAQVYANSGAGTYEKAVDMATREMLSAGLNCIEYKNGARHTLPDYADMAIRTASKRAYLQGEGEKRQEWGITTVIMNKRGNPCPKCIPFVGKVLIDDVWSGGKKSDGPYPLMSVAVAAGLYHPRCKDGHSTYFPGISTADDTWTGEELAAIGRVNAVETKQQHAERQVERFERLAYYSLDEENRRKYEEKVRSWKTIAKSNNSDIIKESVTKEELKLYTVGKLDKDIYKCITDDIKTDEVIITDERIGHIKVRHPNDYERYYSYIQSMIENPDYIVEANKENTGILLKEISDKGEKFKLVLRISVSGDPKDYKNSVISFWHIGDTTWRKTLKNKNILYKKE